MNNKMDWKKIIDKCKKKENFVVILLVGILLMVISIPTKETKVWKEDTSQTEQKQEDTNTSVSELEHRLEKILGNVEGVGNVQEMITLKSNGERVVEKDTDSSESVKEDGTGQVKSKSRDSTKKETTVTYSQGSGSSEPYVIKELEPEIEGVLVIAQGGDSPVVAKNISEAILALFPVDAHKIKVMKSVNQ